jgi:hypothetical protein
MLNLSLKICLLHGNLDIWVKEAKNLPNKDKFHRILVYMLSKLCWKIGSYWSKDDLSSSCLLVKR